MPGENLNIGIGSSSATITEFIQVQDAQRMSKMNSIGLTNVSTTSVPAIEAASVVECGNSIYRFSTQEPISTSAILSTAASTWFIELVPSSSQITAQFSTTIAWRTDYQGYYASTTSVNRTIGKTYFNGTGYNDKMLIMQKGGYYLSSGNMQIDNQLSVGTNDVKGTRGKVHIANGVNADTNWYSYSNLIIESTDDNVINLRVPNNKSAGILWSDPDAAYAALIDYSHNTEAMRVYVQATMMMHLNTNGLLIGSSAAPSYMLDVQGGAYVSSYCYVVGGIQSSGFIYANGNIESSGYFLSAKGRWPTGKLMGNYTQDQIFDALSPYIPNVNDEMIVSGGMYSTLNGRLWTMGSAIRNSTGRITFYSISNSTYQGSGFYVDDGDAQGLHVGLAW